MRDRSREVKRERYRDERKRDEKEMEERCIPVTKVTGMQRLPGQRSYGAAAVNHAVCSVMSPP